MLPFATPAAAAMSSTDVAENPRSAMSATAASTMLPRVPRGGGAEPGAPGTGDGGGAGAGSGVALVVMEAACQMVMAGWRRSRLQVRSRPARHDVIASDPTSTAPR